MKKIQKSGDVGSSSMIVENPLMLMIKLARYKFYSKMMNEKDVVLDLGCGQGVSTNFYSKFSKYVYGVDLLSEPIDHPLKKNIKFIKKDLKYVKI